MEGEFASNLNVRLFGVLHELREDSEISSVKVHVFHPLRCLERFIPVIVALDYVLRNAGPSACDDSLEVFHGNRVWNRVEIVGGAALEEVADDLNLGGLE